MIVLMLAMIASCARQQGTATSEVASPAPVAAGGPQLILPDGAAITLELATDEETRAQGLMFRESLAPDRGMLFLFPDDGVYPFWMKNTLIPLDMIWIDESQTIRGVKTNVPPCRRDPCPSYDPLVKARYVLELAGGVGSRHHLAPGQKVQLRNVSQYPVR